MFLIDIELKLRRYKRNCDTVVTLFENTVRQYPDKVALVMVDGKSWTFRDLDLYSNMVANCFREQVITYNTYITLCVVQFAPLFSHHVH